MTDRLPPLTALRAFEAAARHMSFARAADELNVTPAALSFQIKSLEEHLGAQVFKRLNRAVALTEVGQTLAPGMSEGFERLNATWRATRRLLDGQILNVTAGPAFTALWLAPRLYEFAQAHPEIELRFSAALRMMDFDRDDIDVAIRFGYARDDGLFSKRLIDEYLTPAMTPALAARFPTPESLLRAPLIHDDSVKFLNPPAGWRQWFAAHGIDAPPLHGVRFSNADHAVNAALAGTGVLLGRSSLAAMAVADGRLVAPCDLALGTGASFRFLCPKGAEDRPQIAAFLAWISGEVGRYGNFMSDKRIVTPAHRDV
ncbi:MAG: transcriptional regulator GcvA [Paracoccaceae bacterium]